MAKITVHYSGQIVTREEARATGLKRFFIGERCSHGHIAERYVSSTGCVACVLLRYRADPQRVKDAAVTWRRANPEKAAEIASRATMKWRRANRAPEELLAAQHAWRQQNPEQYRALAARANTRSRGAPQGKFSGADLRELLRRQKGRCAICGGRLGSRYEIDHIVPVSRGGAHDKANLQIVHRGCNVSKSNKDPIEFAQSRGLLL
jgi:5-methylcytosine-specific restriction endonuclease McrA